MKMWWMTPAFLWLAGPAAAQVQVDRALHAEIRQIRAIDNHSHIPPFAPGAEPASVRDPLGVATFPYPVRLRVDSPEWPRVWRALYGVPVSSDPAHVLRRKEQLIRQHGERHIAWVLDRVAIDVALNNGRAPGAGQPAARFRWVPHANALLYPFGGGEGDAAPPTPPPTLEAYEATIAERVNRWKQQDAVALKLTLAYSRSLDFANVTQANAARIYAAAAAASGAAPEVSEYTALQTTCCACSHATPAPPGS